MRSRRRPAAVPSFLLRGALGWCPSAASAGATTTSSDAAGPRSISPAGRAGARRAASSRSASAWPAHAGCATSTTPKVAGWCPGCGTSTCTSASGRMVSQRLDLTGTRSVEEVLDRVTARLAEGPDGPIIGWGHRSAAWTRQPTVSELDAGHRRSPGRS